MITQTETIQTALRAALAGYGQVDYKGRVIATIALHRISEYLSLTPATRLILTNLPYGYDCAEEIKYDQRRVDEVWNLHIWTGGSK